MDCNKLLNIKESHISYELAQRLKNECGITIGGRLSNYVPLLNVAQDIGRQIATIAKQGINFAQTGQLGSEPGLNLDHTKENKSA